MVGVPAGYVGTTLEQTGCIRVCEGEESGRFEKAVFGLIAIRMLLLQHHYSTSAALSRKR